VTIYIVSAFDDINTSMSCEDFSFLFFFLRCLPVNNISAASEMSGVSTTDEVLLNSGHAMLVRIRSCNTEYLRKRYRSAYTRLRIRSTAI
jgi:hypothetical protein